MPVFERIDKLTNSIENAITGERFSTDVIPVKASEIKVSEWQFDWKKETKQPNRTVVKLVTKENPKVIQGLLCFEDRTDHIYMHLLENAKFNKGKGKVYAGVAGNLVAYACKLSFEKGYDGFIAFESKTKLIRHYSDTLGAERFGSGLRMFIDTPNSLKLVKRYFPNETKF